MTATTSSYEIRVAGHLDDHWAAKLGRVELAHGADGTTTITVAGADQAQLHGLLTALRDIGAALLELRAAGCPAPAAEAVLDRPLHTDRLTLRPATPVDADATWPYRRLDSVNEWLTGCPQDIDRYRDLFAEPARLAATVIVTLRDDTHQRVVGDFMLRRQDSWAQLDVAEQARGAQAELGWVLDPAYTGRGYATEAARGLLRYCFADLGVRRVTANCFLANTTSIRLMERIGMRREQHAVRESLHRSGNWLDTVGYAILSDEWSPEPAAHDVEDRGAHAQRRPHLDPVSDVASYFMNDQRPPSLSRASYSR